MKLITMSRGALRTDDSVLGRSKTRDQGGSISKHSAMECARRYLLPQLNLLSRALVVALGAKARDRLNAVGYRRFLAVSAVAPPGCNFAGARESWDKIPTALQRTR